MRKPIGRSQSKSVLTGSVWMVVLSLALFFLPAINGLVGGVVGGYKAGNARRALLAAILPAVLLALGLWVLLSVLGMPVLGVFAGLAVGVWVAVSDLGLFVGALIGGLVRRAQAATG
jgi:hypothetical protein